MSSSPMTMSAKLTAIFAERADAAAICASKESTRILRARLQLYSLPLGLSVLFRPCDARSAALRPTEFEGDLSRRSVAAHRHHQSGLGLGSAFARMRNANPCVISNSGTMNVGRKNAAPNWLGDSPDAPA